MGVGGLRSILEEIAEERSLHELAWDYWLKEAYGDRLMRVGIDVSIWLISTSSIDQRFEAAEASQILLYKLFQIYSAPVQPLFVFDGKDRPSVKRGKEIDRDKQIVNEDMFKDMLDSFGFETWDAPGEAEAELAYLCSIGQLDAVITEDIDALLFRAPIVLAKQPRKGEKELATDSYMVFRMDKIYNKFKLDSSGLILVALLSGGDYDQIGVKGLGHRNAFLLAQARPCQNIPFGELLVTAYKRRPIDQFTDSFLPFFRAELASTLRENKDKTFARRQRKAAEAIPSDFPNIQTLNRYVRPLTSASEGVIGWPGFQTDGREGLGLGEIAGLTKRITGWKDDLLLEKFRRCLWKGAATRVLPAELAYPGGWNMACDRLEVALPVRTSQPRIDDRPQSRMTDHFSVRKRPVHEKTIFTGGPPKLAPASASAAAAVSLLSSPSGGLTEIPSSDPLLPPPPSLTFKSEYPFIKSITLSRRQPSRSNALEYRCVIDPSRFVKETMAGLGRLTGSLLERKRTKKRTDGIDAESLTDEDEEPGSSSGEEEDDDQRPTLVHQPRRSRPLSDPYQPFLVWLPNQILSLTHRSFVQSFEAAQDLKLERSGTKEKNKARKVERWTKEKLGEKDQRAFMDAFLARGQTGNEVEENAVGGVKSREKRKGKEREAIEPTLIEDSSIDIRSDPSEISFIRQSSVPLYSSQSQSQSQIQSKTVLESPSSKHTSRGGRHRISNRNRNGFHRSISNPTIHLSQTPTRPARPLALRRSSRSHLEADNHQAHPQAHASDVTKDRETIHLISSPLFPPSPAPKKGYIRAGSWSPCSKIESTSRPMATTKSTITYTTPDLYPYDNEIVDVGSSSDLNSESETIRGTNESEKRSAKSPRLEQSGLVHDPISIDGQPSDPDLEYKEKRGEPEVDDDFDSVWFELTSSDLRALP